MDSPKCCKSCGFDIVPGGRFIDQDAQEHGYCGEGCREVQNAIKATEMMHQVSNG